MPGQDDGAAAPLSTTAARLICAGEGSSGLGHVEVERDSPSGATIVSMSSGTAR